MGRTSDATRRPKSAAMLGSSRRSAAQSIWPATHASASRARRTVGPTAPRATRTDGPGDRRPGARLAIAMTIALRTPDLGKPCRPSSTGTVADTTSSPGRRAVRFDAGEELVDRQTLRCPPRTGQPDGGVERASRGQGVARGRPGAEVATERRRRCGSGASPRCGRPAASAGRGGASGGCMQLRARDARAEVHRVAARSCHRPQLVDPGQRHHVVGPAMAEVHLDHEVGATREHLRAGAAASASRASSRVVGVSTAIGRFLSVRDTVCSLALVGLGFCSFSEQTVGQGLRATLPAVIRIPDDDPFGALKIGPAVLAARRGRRRPCRHDVRREGPLRRRGLPDRSGQPGLGSDAPSAGDHGLGRDSPARRRRDPDRQEPHRRARLQPLGHQRALRHPGERRGARLCARRLVVGLGVCGRGRSLRLRARIGHGRLRARAGELLRDRGDPPDPRPRVHGWRRPARAVIRHCGVVRSERRCLDAGRTRAARRGLRRDGGDEARAG